MTSDAVLDRLLKLHPKAIDLSLDRIERLLDSLGHPELRLPPVVHVAGTNGKGSLVAFLDAMLTAAGHRVHAYVSPHLVRFAERIRLAGTEIDEGSLTRLLHEAEDANGGRPITFFEITTAAAFLAFSRSEADILLLETGLGGRLDATNLVPRPALTAITPVAIDHTQFLGDTLAAIAAEKAGILKPGVGAMIGPQPGEAMAAIAARADAVGAPLLVAGRDWSGETCGDGWRFRGLGRDLMLPPPALPGRHQIDNAASAVACIASLPGFAVDPAAIAAGLRQVRNPGRLQRLRSGPLIAAAGGQVELWLDGGHNAAAGAALAATAAEQWRDRPLDLVVAMLASKDPEGFLRPFAGIARRLRAITVPGEANSHSAETVAAAGRAVGMDAAPTRGIEDAVGELGQAGPARILICGSLYLAGRVLRDNR